MTQEQYISAFSRGAEKRAAELGMTKTAILGMIASMGIGTLARPALSAAARWLAGRGAVAGAGKAATTAAKYVPKLTAWGAENPIKTDLLYGNTAFLGGTLAAQPAIDKIFPNG